ncbi:MAG: energy transducer TonB [Cyclobacteriaceae bacterium]
MGKIRNVNLEFSCPESIDSMKPTLSGFNCSRCSKELIDFRGKSEEEFQQMISDSGSSTCGVFKPSQLSQKFLRYAAATFIATASTLVANGQKPIESDSLEIAVDSLEGEEEGDEFFLGTIVEYQAEPIGGYLKFMESISKSIQYPPELKQKGKVYIQFTVDTLGQMGEFKIVKGFNELADKEVLKSMTNLNFPFSPAKQRGKPIKSRLVLPITFEPKIEE